MSVRSHYLSCFEPKTIDKINSINPKFITTFALPYPESAMHKSNILKIIAQIISHDVDPIIHSRVFRRMEVFSFDTVRNVQ